MAQQKVNRGSGLIGLFYSLVFINAMRLFFVVSSLFNSKTRRGYRGRRNLFVELEKKLSTVPEGKRIWFHASSLGEFEQAKPIIELLKDSGYRAIVTFFSPSGRDHSLMYPNADVITYIPLDTRRNARRFVDLVRPSVVVVMRYDLWLNHLLEAKRIGAKVILADATFPTKLFQRPPFIRTFFKYLYGACDEILTTTEEHKKMFDSFVGEGRTHVAGDTRFDRVFSRSVKNSVTDKLPFKVDRSNRLVMILGSTWPQDIDVVSSSIIKLVEEFEKLSVIIVPHEPSSEEVDRLTALFPGMKVMSKLDGDSGDFSFLVVDRVGLLTQLYVLGDMAYVGGAFGTGVHNVLEPAVYGIPIVTGPRIEKSDEAIQLLREGGLFFVKNAEECYDVLRKMVNDKTARQAAGSVAKAFVDRHLGASTCVANKIKEMCSQTPEG